MNLDYSGIGTRYPTEPQRQLIERTATYLAERDYVLHSGAAIGVDQLFSTTAINRGSRAILHLPWKKHADEYVASLSDQQRQHLEVRVLPSKRNQRDHEAFASVDQYHPEPDELTWGARLLHARNYRILVPDQKVGFVVALPTRHNGQAVGGTMQGIRIARALNIPIVRLDLLGWTQVEQRLIRLTSAGLWGKVTS